MQEKLPILASAHHASDNFGKYERGCRLTPEQRKRFSDYGTAKTAPQEGIYEPLIAKSSRSLIDLNRDTDSSTLFPETDFARPPNAIWQPGMQPSQGEREIIRREIYDPYHDRLLQAVRSFERPGIVIAWDNTAHYEISNAATGEKEMMPPFILSNRGTRDSAEMADTKELNAREETIRTTTCEPSLLTEFAEELKRSLKKIGLPAEVFLNRVYKGGYIGEHYNTRRHHEEMNTSQPVESFQFEYDTRLTHDQETLEPDNDAMDRLRRAVEQALRKTYVNLLSHNVGDVSGNIPTNLQKKLNS